MRIAMLVGLSCLAASLPCQGQTAAAARPRVELPVSFALDTALVPVARSQRSDATALVGLTREVGGTRVYSRTPFRAGTATTVGRCALPRSLVAGVGIVPLGRLRTDGTWVYRVDPFSDPCTPALAFLPSRWSW